MMHSKKMFGLVLLLGSVPVFAQIPVNPGGGSGGGGCSSGTTTNLLSGDGAGGCSSSGIASSNVLTLSGTQTVSGAKTFSAASISANLSVIGAFGIIRNTGAVLTWGTNATGFGVSEAMSSTVTATSGNFALHDLGVGANAFTPASGTGNFAGMAIDPVINGTSSGTAYGLLVAPVTQTLTGGKIRLISAGQATGASFAGYTEKFFVDTAGGVNAPQFIGFGSTPTIVAGAAAGTTPTVSVTGTSTAFTVNVTAGSTPSTTGIIATVTFTTYGLAPHIGCFAKNAATAAFSPNFFATTTATTAVLNSAAVGLTGSGDYSWDCLVIQ